MRPSWSQDGCSGSQAPCFQAQAQQKLEVFFKKIQTKKPWSTPEPTSVVRRVRIGSSCWRTHHWNWGWKLPICFDPRKQSSYQESEECMGVGGKCTTKPFRLFLYINIYFFQNRNYEKYFFKKNLLSLKVYDELIQLFNKNVVFTRIFALHSRIYIPGVQLKGNFTHFYLFIYFLQVEAMWTKQAW